MLRIYEFDYTLDIHNLQRRGKIGNPTETINHGYVNRAH